MGEFDHDKYFEAKAFWENWLEQALAGFKARNTSWEEHDAMLNALEDKADELLL